MLMIKKRPFWRRTPFYAGAASLVGGFAVVMTALTFQGSNFGNFMSVAPSQQPNQSQSTPSEKQEESVANETTENTDSSSSTQWAAPQAAQPSGVSQPSVPSQPATQPSVENQTQTPAPSQPEPTPAAGNGASQPSQETPATNDDDTTGIDVPIIGPLVNGVQEVL
jgi:cytoskeletal protein RodZ